MPPVVPPPVRQITKIFDHVDLALRNGRRRNPLLARIACAWLVFVTSMLVSAANAQTHIAVGYKDFYYGTTGTGTPTGEKPESKLWWNDGYWWGSLYNDAAQEFHIYRFEPATHSWQDTGTVLDDRNSSRADVLWDAETNKLYLVSHIFTTLGQTTTSSSWGRLYVYTYNSSTKTYTKQLQVNNVTRGKSETLTLAKDTTGTLWATYVEGSKVMVNHSSGTNYASWGTPYVLPISSSAVNVSSDDISSIIAFGGKVGVMLSNQLTSRFYFATHAMAILRRPGTRRYQLQAQRAWLTITSA
ncbi:MAG TPA: hypothetical protein VN622_02115 [Clostridia bacterium]|nr:hypothetical protein [Clostridia bacterium]